MYTTVRDSTYSSTSGSASNMRGSVHLRSGIIHEVTTQLVHPYTRLDYESCNYIADKIFKQYGGTGYSTKISFEQAKRIMQDVNKACGRKEEPTEEDIKDFVRFHDRDDDGEFTKKDLEAVCTNYLSGPGGNGYSLLGKETPNQRLINYFKQEQDPNLIMPDMTHVSRLFDQYDNDHNGELDRREVRDLLQDTFKVLKKDHVPTEEEVNSYLGGKERINKTEFENMLLNSLAKRNLVKTGDN